VYDLKKIKEEILAILKTNARAPILDIAKMVNLPRKEVEKLITSMEKEGIIVQYSTIINEKKIDTTSYVRALIELGVRPESRTGFDAIAKRIAKFPQVVEHFLISGNYDFLIIVQGESLEDISRFVSEKLASIENIRSIATHFIMKKYKENSVVIESDEIERLMVSP